MITYRELREQLMELTEEQLDCDVTIELGASNEIFSVDELRICDFDHDVLDEDHPVLYLEEI